MANATRFIAPGAAVHSNSTTPDPPAGTPDNVATSSGPSLSRSTVNSPASILPPLPTVTENATASPTDGFSGVHVMSSTNRSTNTVAS